METQTNRFYTDKDVLTSARERMSLVFDNFENIIVSVSSGKDSTALFWIAVQEAEKRGRLIKVFFLDQEAEYQSSIDLINKMMVHPCVIPLWYQVPLCLTNATSYKQDMFYAWGGGEKWIREKNPLAIHKIDSKYPKRFYKFFNWMEKNNENTAFLVGLRSEESLNRLRAVILFPGWNNITWSTKTLGVGTFRFYPIYDWGMGDVWKFINDNGVPYNAIYDKMFRANKNYYKTMRVSNLIHEKSFKVIADLQVYEPDTFNKLVERISGIHVASIYAREKSVFDTNKLPSCFDTWLSFRDYLLQTSPLKNKERFVNRFENQTKDEDMYRKQVRQILLNDHENNLGVHVSKVKNDKKADLLKKWWDIL